MNLQAIMAAATQLAHTVAEATQQGPVGIVGDVVNIGGKVIDIIDTLKQKQPTGDIAPTQSAMIHAREILAARVKAHAAATSADLRKPS